VTVTRDGGLDRSVGKVELERARRRRFAGEREGDVDLEQLAIASVPDVLLLREIGDLGGDVPVQRLLELIGGGKGAADDPGSSEYTTRRSRLQIFTRAISSPTSPA
jgi:hypothetical protein